MAELAKFEVVIDSVTYDRGTNGGGAVEVVSQIDENAGGYVNLRIVVPRAVALDLEPGQKLTLAVHG